MIFLNSAQSLGVELPIRKHLIDATKLNHERIFEYAKLTNFKSYRLSRELILMEELALIYTIPLDLKAKKYIENGINIFQDDLVDMQETPSFLPNFENNNYPTERISLEMDSLRKKWLKNIKEDQLDIVYADALYLLDHAELSHLNQNCLSRHFVESIARSILNLPHYRQKSKVLGLEDPTELAVKFLKVQINSLNWAYSLDKRAFPIQKNNVPLFCRDVPAIPYKNTF